MKKFTALTVAKEFDFANLTAKMFEEFKYIPCLQSQESSVGFGEYQEINQETGEEQTTYLKKIQHFIYLTLVEEKKKLPSPKELKVMVQKRLYKMEQEGQEITKDTELAVETAIKQEAINRAFSSVTKTTMIVDTQDHVAYVGSNLKKAESISALLREVVGSFPVTPLVTNLTNSPAEFYTHIVNPKVHHDLILGSSANFAHPESGAIHSIKKQELDSATAEIEPLLARHFLVTEIQLTDAGKLEATYVVNSNLEFTGVKEENLTGLPDDGSLLLTANVIKQICSSLVAYIEAK